MRVRLLLLTGRRLWRQRRLRWLRRLALLLVLALVLGLRLQLSMLRLQELRPTHAWHRHAWHRQLLLLVPLLLRRPQRGCAREAWRSSSRSREVAAG